MEGPRFFLPPRHVQHQKWRLKCLSQQQHLHTPTIMATTTPAQDAIASSLAQERPTIDAAVKSFLSLYTARSLTRGQGDDSQQEALLQARILLKTINQYTFPLQAEPNDEYKITAQVWNGLIASSQKPSKLLGRSALKLAWENGLVQELPTEQQESDFIKEFGHLLLSYSPDDSESTQTLDSDACLVWDADQGAAELARRRSRRAERAKEAESNEQSLTIEELEEDDDETKQEDTTTAPTIEHVQEETKQTSDDES